MGQVGWQGCESHVYLLPLVSDGSQGMLQSSRSLLPELSMFATLLLRDALGSCSPGYKPQVLLREVPREHSASSLPPSLA